MDLRSLLQILNYQVQAMRDAPIPPAIAVLATATLVWLFLKWRYAGKIETLRRAIARRDSELANLRAYAAATAAADGPLVGEGDVAPALTVPAASGGRSKPLRLILNAIEEADLALRSGDPREAERALASMGLALRTAHTSFALPVPTFGTDPMADIAIGKRFLERIRPPLRAGDDATAQREAMAFLAVPA